MAYDPELRKAAEKRVGRSLRGKWHLDRLLDIGGMAAVYEATHRNGNRAAVKILHPFFPPKSNVRERFLREGYLANKVNHPAAVAVLDDDTTEDGAAFLVMELLEGQSMEALLQRSGGDMSVQHVLAIADQTLDVLANAHAAGVVHRDIKPGNLFLTKQGQVKVLDFGLARIKEADPKTQLTVAGVVMGTSSYMSPEQARSKWDLVDGRTDLFAVGAVMFRSLSGRVVHEAETPNDRLLAAMSLQARSLATVAPHVHKAVVEVVDRSLKFEMNDRWPDASAMQLAVRRAFAVMTAQGDIATQACANPTTGSAQISGGESTLVDVNMVESGRSAPASSGESIVVDMSMIESRRSAVASGGESIDVRISALPELGVEDIVSNPSRLTDGLPEVSAIPIEEVRSERDVKIDPDDEN